MHIYNENLAIIDNFFYSMFPTYSKITQAPHFKIFILIGSFSLLFCRLLQIYDPIMLIIAVIICMLRICESITKLIMILLKEKSYIFKVTPAYTNVYFTPTKDILLTPFVNFGVTLIWVLFIAFNFRKKMLKQIITLT